MKLYKKNLEIWKHEIYLLPTLKIIWNDRIYRNENFAIEFHFLILHARLLWLKEV